MLKKYVVPLTLTFLAGLYLGCTNPQTVVDTAKQLDPRTPAGNATGPTSGTFTKQDATGFWVSQNLEGNYAQNMVVKQATDGTLTGSFGDGPVKDAKNVDGEVTLIHGYSNYTYRGTISADGTTLTLTKVDEPTNQYKCTRMFTF